MGLEFNSELFLYFATITYMTVGISAAFIKGFHVCLPYKSRPNFYFPNRIRWVMIYASTILLLGCVICPDNNENWIAGRCYTMMIPPSLIICGIRKHCDQFHKETVWYRITDYIPTSIETIICILAFLHLGIVEKYESVILGITYFTGSLYTLGIALTLLWLRKKIHYYFENKYSNEEEFPSNFATMMIYLSLVALPLLWTTFVSTNHLVTGIALLVLSFYYIGVLIYTLDTHIELKTTMNVTISGTEEEINVHEGHALLEDCKPIKIEDTTETLEQLEAFMRENKPYLDPHLTIMDIAHDMKANFPLLRLACKSKYGSFIRMVNLFRLEYANELHKDHPEYSKQAIAEESGFGSYRSLLRAEKYQTDDEYTE